MGESSVEDLERELKSLRQGHGLTAARLASCPSLLAALGTGTVNEALQRLLEEINGLGEGVQARALRTAFGIGMPDPGILKNRRIGFGAAIGRFDQGTLIGYENAAIRDLAIRLTPKPKPDVSLTGVYLMRGVYRKYQFDRVVISNAATEEDFSRRGANLELLPLSDPPHPQCLIFTVPQNSKISRLYVAVEFLDEPPTIVRTCWYADTRPPAKGFGQKDAPKTAGRPEHWTYRFERPDPGMKFGLFWLY